jgi:CRISPR-associated protein Cas2
MKKKKQAGLSNSKQLVESCKNTEIDELPLSERLEKILNMINKKDRNPTSVYSFITYDIEDNKIRGHIAKYLQRLGMIRVQYSVFFGDINRDDFNKAKDTLSAINDMYENNDSIFIIPIGEDILNKTKVIGKNVDFEVIAETRSTLFF